MQKPPLDPLISAPDSDEYQPHQPFDRREIVHFGGSGVGRVGGNGSQACVRHQFYQMRGLRVGSGKIASILVKIFPKSNRVNYLAMETVNATHHLVYKMPTN